MTSPRFPAGFLWGAATAAHQVEGNNLPGYLHWTLLDNFERERREPTFGLVAVDRETFERRPEPSLSWLGSGAGANAIEADR